MTAAEASSTLATHGIDFVDKQNTGGVLLAGVEQVAHAACTNAHEHFHKVRARHAEEGHSRFASNRTGKEGLAGTRRSYQQRPLRNPSAQFVVFFRVFQELHQFLQVLLGLVAASHVVEGGLFLRVAPDDFGLAFSKTEGVLAATAHLAAHHEVEEGNQQERGQERHQRVDPGGRFVDYLHLDALEHFPGGNLLV